MYFTTGDCLSFLHRAQVVVLEASERVGGWVHSAHTEEGAVLELGPRSLRIAGAAGKTTLALVSMTSMWTWRNSRDWVRELVRHFFACMYSHHTNTNLHDLWEGNILVS